MWGMNNKRWSEDHGYEVVRQWRGSGLPMSKFARAQGYSEQRVRYWREREAAARPSAATGARLLPGVVVGAQSGVSIWVEMQARREATQTPHCSRCGLQLAEYIGAAGPGWTCVRCEVEP
jgi:hypothetical protein